MTDDRERIPGLPEAGVGGEGPLSDQTVLAPESDGEIEKAIRDAFFLHPNLPSAAFSVRVEEGVAYVGGDEPNEELRQQALDIAANVQRVERVVPVFDQT